MYGFTAETKESSSVSKFIQVTPETAIATGRFIKELKFEDNNGNRKLLKTRYDQKIDNVSALLDGFVAWKNNKEAFE